jgi:hypothetical protein
MGFAEDIEVVHAVVAGTGEGNWHMLVVEELQQAAGKWGEEPAHRSFA